MDLSSFRHRDCEGPEACFLSFFMMAILDNQAPALTWQSSVDPNSLGCHDKFLREGLSVLHTDEEEEGRSSQRTRSTF